LTALQMQAAQWQQQKQWQEYQMSLVQYQQQLQQWTMQQGELGDTWRIEFMHIAHVSKHKIVCFLTFHKS